MNRRILFVDDEPRVLEGLEHLLARYRRKWDMVFASSGAAALEEIRRGPVDVIVTDMRMPGMDGATLLRAVKEERPGAVRIILSGQSDMEMAMRAAEVAHQFLDKPCNPEVLESVVERACSLNALVSDESLRKLVGGLKRLPALPAAYAALQRTLADERSSVPEVARIIERDIGMSVKVLQLVNSSFFGLRRRISAVAEAVGYLGFRMIQQLVLAAEVFGTASSNMAGGLALENLRDHSLLTAAMAHRILADDKRQAEDAWTAGLLHDIGRLVLAVCLPERLAAVTTRMKETGQTFFGAELELYGITHAEIGAYLVGMWGLPYPIVEAVALHHLPGRVQHAAMDVLTAVHVANGISRELEASGERSSGILDLAYVDKLGLTDRLDRWREEARELASTMTLETLTR